MIEPKQPLTAMEKRLDCLAGFLSDQGHPIPLPILREGIARYEGAFDWVALEAQLHGAPKQPGPLAPTLSRAERKALGEVFDSWDRTKSFQAIVDELCWSTQVPDAYVRKPAYSEASAHHLAEVLGELAKEYEDLRMVEFRALETCLTNWGGMSYDEVLDVLDSGDDVMMEHLEMWESTSEMTPAELAAKIRSEYNFFRMNMPGQR